MLLKAIIKNLLILEIKMTQKHGLTLKVKPCVSVKNFVDYFYVEIVFQDFLVLRLEAGLVSDSSAGTSSVFS
jgi:hypothetical protein